MQCAREAQALEATESGPSASACPGNGRAAVLFEVIVERAEQRRSCVDVCATALTAYARQPRSNRRHRVWRLPFSSFQISRGNDGNTISSEAHRTFHTA